MISHIAHVTSKNLDLGVWRQWKSVVEFTSYRFIKAARMSAWRLSWFSILVSEVRKTPYWWVPSKLLYVTSSSASSEKFSQLKSEWDVLCSWCLFVFGLCSWKVALHFLLPSQLSFKKKQFWSISSSCPWSALCSSIFSASLFSGSFCSSFTFSLTYMYVSSFLVSCNIFCIEASLVFCHAILSSYHIPTTH